MIYADYSFYVGSFLGTRISENDFHHLAVLASQYLDYITLGKAKKYPDTEGLKMACCALAEKYQVIENAEKVSVDYMVETGGIKTESVGSYSVSYQTSGDKMSAVSSSAESARNSLASTARQYLIGTNLLYRGGC